MTGTGTDEYIVLGAFLCGLLTYSCLAVRTLRRIAWTLAIFAASAVTAWFFVASESGDWLELMLFTAFAHAIAFSVVYRAQLMPVITVAGLMHYTLLGYYGLALSARAAGVVLPTSILVVGVIPAAFVVVFALVGSRAGPWMRKLAYGWFLILLTGLVIQEVGMLAEHGPRRGEGPLFEAAIWFFFLGPLWLYFVSNIIYLIMMLPAERAGDAVLWRALGVEGESYDAQHRAEAAKRVTGLAITPFRLLLLASHAAILAGNWVYDLVPNGILISVSIVVLIQLEAWMIGRVAERP